MLIVPMVAIYSSEKDSIAMSIRQTGKIFEGYYEFPGGKCERGETVTEALRREIYEELDVSLNIENLYPVTFDDFRFKEKEYLLALYFCDSFDGEIYGKEGQSVHWIPRDDLLDCNIIPTNEHIIPVLFSFINRHLEKD